MKPETDETLRDLIQFAKKANLEEIVWKDEGLKISFRRDPSPVAAPSAASASDASTDSEPAVVEETVRSPMVGTFRRGVSKDRPPLVMIGNHIKPGDHLGVVECMKIPTDVVSFCAGEIKQIMVEDGQTVEYGQPLFVVTPVNGENGNE
jgi:biotin carboxyl carrier protein